MKGYIISHHGINTQKGKLDINYFTELYSKFTDKTISTSPISSRSKVELDFEEFKGTIVYYTVLCGKRKRPITVFGTENGDRVYIPAMQSDFEKLIANHEGKSNYPSWYRNL
ncbi:hypothetical protein I6Y99_003251 [Vibrio parahaemolyticus]|uniref:hypothetical protein n=4 Tax=Vibrio parahaemolyticus TaxID=670 RepID=UPI0003C7C670|nr:hypothetical protein [Vibrio parahaemolyticus]EGQ7791934.1 hypothetical protein [Vibrio parahaemolyticus]EGQ7809272.1 hypothetical protein [Vibrio parahaemolyticus]EGQ8533103.1 hypothetical protein [Vibrio parahaemolyticus]EHJ9961260.1 hypothetical protein [Vibrio parahaemolyticus]EHJ9981356.1 hypothetical protein [Vibrio parahaemolyticus]